MALQTIRFGNFAGVRQVVGAGGIKLNWAANAQNVSTACGRLSRVKGYQAQGNGPDRLSGGPTGLPFPL